MLDFSAFLSAVWISIFPGPTTLFTAVLGNKYGILKTFKFISGAVLGFVSLGLLASFGRIYLLEGFDIFIKLLKYCGCVYIFSAAVFIMIDYHSSWLDNYKISFAAGLILNCINPFSFESIFKAFYKDIYSSVDGIIFVFTQLFIGFVVLSSWAYLGEYISRMSTHSSRNRVLDFVAGSVLISQVGYVLFCV